MDKQPKVAIAFERVVVIRLKLVSLQMDKQQEESLKIMAKKK